MKKFLAALAVCTIMATPGKAGPIELVGGELNEFLRPAAQISGATLVGAMVVSSRFSDDLGFTADVPRAWAGSETCVSMISADGLYEATNTYRIAPDWVGGAVAVSYPSSYPDKLMGLGNEEFAALGRPGPCAADRTDEVIPIGWRYVKPGSNSGMRVFLNSFHADEVYLFIGENPDAPAVSCVHPVTETATAFDFICDFPLDSNGELVEVEINRVSGGQIAPPTHFRIRLPSQ